MGNDGPSNPTEFSTVEAFGIPGHILANKPGSSPKEICAPTHPLAAESQWKFSQQELQAIGRVVRYGQEKHVYIHRFIVDDSIDSVILGKWKKQTISELEPIEVSADVNDFNVAWSTMQL